MIVKLLTEHHLEFLSLKGGCTGSSESTLIKMPHCWKSHATAQICFLPLTEYGVQHPEGVVIGNRESQDMSRGREVTHWLLLDVRVTCP